MHVSLAIYDAIGRKISALVNEELIYGEYEVNWDVSIYSSGIYFYNLTIDKKNIETKKMILVK